MTTTLPFTRTFSAWGPALLTLVLLLTGCSESRRTQTATGGSATGSTDEIPALFERRGQLAQAEEWPRTRGKVDELMQKIRKEPANTKNRLQLAAIFLSEARITGEHPYYYPAVLRILDGVLAIDPKNFEATTYKASVMMSQHRFAEARALAEKARQMNPNNAYVYGVLVDANVELGHYEEAVAMSDKMQQLKPSLESYSRASYLREIYGNYPGAIEAMKLAVQAGLPGSEPFCWSRTTLGYLYETTGKLQEAENQYADVLALRPSYAFALRGLGRVQKARKRYDEALFLLDSAARIMPEFSFHEEMAEIYGLKGNPEQSVKKYGEVVQMLQEDARSGHRVDLELCKVYTAAGRLDSALFYGLREYRVRPRNIDVNRALAWVYYHRHLPEKAQQHMQVALRTGSKDPELLRQAGAVEVALGHVKEGNRLLAQARKVNPIAVL
ncbi:tetratricopeptide repeat protein [Larkinella soli]|uniref:tetratricopeptide repeat protein n=1 Tax=Larkinella soli TaxID=1770527 RepID=UPI000FFC9922|nr:tetratricopeptide repeat protein [Larkinella soli]